MTRADMPTDHDKDRRLSLRVPPDVYAQVERAAAREHRTVAGWVKALIASALEREAGTKKR